MVAGEMCWGALAEVEVGWNTLSDGEKDTREENEIDLDAFSVDEPVKD